MIRSYRDLDVWKKAIMLTTDIYRLTNDFPKKETYGLASQIQRSAVSVAANIAEGHSRNSTKEFLHFIGIAYGSLAELETHAVVACNLNYINSVQQENLFIQSSEVGKMLNGLDKALRQKIPAPRPLTSEPSYAC